MSVLARAFAITRVELRRFLRDRSNIFFVFVLPLALVIFIGLQFGDLGGTQIGVVRAGDDAAAAQLTSQLDASPNLEIVEVGDEEELIRLVSRANLAGGIVIPDGYEQALAEAGTAEVGFVARPDQGSQSLRTVVRSAVADQAAVADAARSAAVVLGTAPQELLVAAQEGQVLLTPVTVTTQAVGGDELMAEFAGMGQFDLGASSQLFLFVFLTSLAGSGALIQTRRYGVATRMLSTPTRLPVLLTGIAGGRFAIAGFQALYIIVVTAVVFQVDWGDPLATGLLVTLFCLLSAAAGMVLGAVFRNDSQASGAGVGIGLVMAALGGSMMPLDFFPEGMRRVAMVTPHGWANSAMTELVRRDGALADVATQLMVLAGITVGLLALATWLLRRAITR